MSITKHAYLRYKTLDRCFRNTGRNYFIEDLIDECSKMLIEINPDVQGISRRTIFSDIGFMESSDGWEIPLDRVTDGKRVYYRYTDPTFSINNQPLNMKEADQLRSALTIMSRFSGAPQFEWVDELHTQLKAQFNLEDSDQPIISFESNLYLKGKELIGELFEAILNKIVLEITYQDFKSPEPYGLIFHPYYLKQYNGRWFVFGFDEITERIRNLALDRIQSFSKSTNKYRPTDIVWENQEDGYLDDIIGVSKPYEGEIKTIELLFDTDRAPYIETKPIHPSQSSKRVENGLLVKLEVIPNYELEQLILSFGEGVKVLAPSFLSERIQLRLTSALARYEKK
jgi:predicted DNA-binding transcriptional regulator YafY